MLDASSEHSSANRQLRARVNLVWLTRLRWAAIVGQATAIAVTQWILNINIAWRLLYAIVGLEIAINLALQFSLKDRDLSDRVNDRLLSALMAMDLVFLTGLLICSGGPLNPFSVFYIVNVSLAAATLSANSAWALTALAVLGFGSLFCFHVPVAELSHEHPSLNVSGHMEHHAGSLPGEPSSMSLHLRGMLLAFAGAAGFVTYFVNRVRRELHAKEAELADAERNKIQALRLESLATLAAGAAHELATPLATIMVASREIELRAVEQSQHAEFLEEARVISGEAARCRSILSSLRTEAGERGGETWCWSGLADIVDEAVRATADPNRIRWNALATGPSHLEFQLPRKAVVQTLKSLMQNALAASPEVQPVQVLVGASTDRVEIRVIDQGVGMCPQILSRLGEPFFTTRPPGQGMGLGVFLAQRVSRQLGGDLTFVSQPDAGTTATLILPAKSRLVVSSSGEGLLIEGR
ncbi:MAG: ATP-binding protein [Pirellulales bacterium]